MLQAFCGVEGVSSEGLCTSTERPLAEMGWPRTMWAKGQAGGVPERYWGDEVLWSTRSLVGKLRDWQCVKGGSVQFCCRGAGLLPVPAVGCGGGQRLASQRQRGQDYPICSDTPKRWAWSQGLMQKAYQKAGSGLVSQSLMISLKLVMISLKCNKIK